MSPLSLRDNFRNLLCVRTSLRRCRIRKLTRDGVAAAALEFLILTAARTGEVIGARRSEIDFRARMWTVPPTRMKGKREHRVPLSPAA
jgi:integrase